MTKPLIVITGASSGFGAAMARQFSELGHPLLLVARRLDRIKALELPNALCRQVDVADRDTLKSTIIEAEALYGPVDCLINNAGCMLLGQLDTQDPEEWQRMFDVNVIGLMNGIQSVLPEMKQRQGGTIINISSIAGRKSFPNHTAYCGTKFAVHAISETVREEVADDNVRVITIAPGAAETELLSHTTSQEIIDGYTEWKQSMGGVISANDVARCAVFAYQQPQNMCVREILVAPTRQQA